MSTAWSAEELLRPIAPDAPCGENLDDAGLVGTLDRLNVFGRQMNYSARSKDPVDNDGTTEPEWSDVQDAALAGLARSKDLRALVHLGAAGLWTEGFHPFIDTLGIAADWLDTYWTDVYPRLDEDDGDAMIRQGALLCFADTSAVINRVRRVPLSRGRLQEPVCFRDVEILQGQVQPTDSDRRVSESDLEVAFADTPLEVLQALLDGLGRATESVKRITKTMEAQAGNQWAPDLSPLSAVLVRIERYLAPKVAARGGVAADGDAPGEETGGVSIGGVLRSRQDAIRALDAVATYFRQTEPSSPVPLLVDRAKRLVSKDFLEVLADIAPEALGHARAAGGLPPIGE